MSIQFTQNKEKNKTWENATKYVCKVQTGGRRETYPSGEKKYYEMDVLLLMQHEHRNQGFSVAAINSNIPACYEYQVTAT